MARNSTSGRKESIISTTITKQEETHLLKLAEHKHIFDLFKQTNELVGFHTHIQQEVADAYRVEHPHFHYNSSCAVCVSEMIITIYTWYENKLK